MRGIIPNPLIFRNGVRVQIGNAPAAHVLPYGIDPTEMGVNP